MYIHDLYNSYRIPLGKRDVIQADFHVISNEIPRKKRVSEL